MQKHCLFWDGTGLVAAWGWESDPQGRGQSCQWCDPPDALIPNPEVSICGTTQQSADWSRCTTKPSNKIHYSRIRKRFTSTIDSRFGTATTYSVAWCGFSIQLTSMMLGQWNINSYMAGGNILLQQLIQINPEAGRENYTGPISYTRSTNVCHHGQFRVSRCRRNTFNHSFLPHSISLKQ